MLRLDYTYARLVREYVREQEPASASLYDDVIDEQIEKYITTEMPSASIERILYEVRSIAETLSAQYRNYTDEEYIDSFMNEHTVTYYEYTRTHVVPSSTLFIGTYLIDAMAINDVYYRYAKDTMGLHNQQIMYYKSELDSGHWKDIISAAGLEDILPASGSVQDADMMAYKITCVIGSDGIPRYPDDDTEADIFNMTDPYDMAAVPELLPLKTIFDTGAVSQDSKDVSNRYAADVLYRFFNYDGSGENVSKMIIRNKAYRDYLIDHPNKKNAIIGNESIPMAATVRISDDEIRYVTSLADMNIQFSANMPQSEDRYPGKNEAFFDQLLAWSEYYGNGKFSDRIDSLGIARPIILPAENFSTSAWESGNRYADWDNPQSYLYILNGMPGTPDANAFVDRWLSDTYVDYGETVVNGFIEENIYNLSSGNWTESKINDITSAITGVQYDNPQFGTRSTTSVKVAWGSGWTNFCDLMYRYMDWMRNMYDVRDEVTYEDDRILEELYELYKTERNAGNVEEADTLMRLMSRVDASRRARIYYNLVYNEEHNVVVGPTLIYLLGLLQNGQGALGQNFEYIGGAEETNFAISDVALSIAEDAVVSCQKKYAEYNGIAFGEGSTVIRQKEYELSLQVMNAETEEDRSSALHDLSLIYNVEEGAIVDKSEERRVIDEIMETAGANYSASIHEVAGEDYLIAAADPSNSKATLTSYLELQKADADGDVAQLQNLIRAYALRLNTSEGIMFINRRLDWAETQQNGIQSDDPYGPFALDSLKQHITWLKNILKEIKNGTLNGDNPLPEIDLKVEYQAQMLDALDNDDLNLADTLQAEIDSLYGAGGIGGTGGIDSSAGGTEGGDASVDDIGLGDLIDEIRSEIIDDPTDPDRVPTLVEALGALGDPNIGELQDLFDRYNAGRDTMNSLASAIENAANSEINPSGDGDGADRSGDDGNGGLSISDRDLMSAIEGALGISFDNLADDDKAAVVAACTRYGRDMGYEDVTNFGIRVQTQALGEDNPFFYHQYVGDPTQTYVNLAAVDRPRLYTGYRYVKLGRTVTMTQVGRASMSGSYSFVVGDKTVTDRSGKTSQLIKNAVQQTDEYIRGSLTRNYAYIDSEDADKYLGITCEYVTNTEYAVFLTQRIETKATLIYNAIDELITELLEELEAEQNAAAESAATETVSTATESATAGDAE